jgi:hypothetical protein
VTRSVHISPRAEHCRLQAKDAGQRAALAADQTPAKAAFEAIANHWTALAEQVEWLERNRSRGASAESWGPAIGRMLVGFATLGLAGFAALVAIGIWVGNPEAATWKSGGTYEHRPVSEPGSLQQPRAGHPPSAAERAAKARASRAAVAIEE